MNPASVAKACDSVSAPALGFEPVRRFLIECGLDEAASLYGRRQAGKYLENAGKGERHLLNLLVADRIAVERFTKLGNHCRGMAAGLGAGRNPARHAIRAANEIDKKCRSRLKRLFHHTDASTLGPLLLVEATAALSAHLGRPEPLRVTIRLNDASAPRDSGAVAVRSLCRLPGVVRV